MEDGMFLRNCWYVAAWDHELSQGTPIARTVIGEPLVLFRGADGRALAWEDRCLHRHAPLSKGRVEGDGLRCLYHGLAFDGQGRCRHAPGSGPVPGGRVRTFPLALRSSWLWVWMGDPALADPALIPEAFGLDDASWTMRAGQIDYAANYLLINDNLCDLSHVDFVHADTLSAATGGGWSDEMPRIQQLDRGIRVERWFTARPASPTNPSLVDTWSTYDFLAPGVFVMTNKSYPHGQAEHDGLRAPSAKPMTHRIEQQAVTPIDERRTRYFFATGFESANLPSKLIEGIFATIMAAFAEDREMIEGQQRIWDATPAGTPMTFLPQDKGPAMMRRTLERLVRREAEAAGKSLERTRLASC
jgi:vanillate O-demethylase monooxygenase subunit